MSVVKKAYKIRIYPNSTQRTQMAKTFGCARFLYNAMLRERIDFYEAHKEDKETLHSHKYNTEKQYKEELEWLKDVDSIALQASREHLQNAFRNFFHAISGKRRGGVVGYPKFKSKKSEQSYTTKRVGNNIQLDFQRKKIKLPKLGWLPYRDNREFEGEIKRVTVRQTTTGKYFASILVEEEMDIQPVMVDETKAKITGLDMSMDKFFVDEMGESPEFNRWYRSLEKKLVREQRRLSRKKKGSKNRDKQRKRVAAVHEKIRNLRQDFVHKLSKQLVDNKDVIVVENLSLSGMSRALKLGKSVHDLGYSEFVRQLQYKSKWYGAILIEADKWFASSKTCSKCGYVHKQLQLTDRTWVCSNCGTEHNRDQNAGQNLVEYGRKFLGMGSPEVTLAESSPLGSH